MSSSTATSSAASSSSSTGTSSSSVSTSTSSSSSVSSVSCTELLVNGDFSAGLAPWSLWTDPGATATGQVTGGEFTADITSAAADWQVQLAVSGLAVNQNDTYYIAFDGRCAAGTKTITVVLRENGGAYTEYHSQSFTLNTTMNRYQTSFTMSNPSDPAAQLLVYLGSDTTSVALDNFSLSDCSGSSSSTSTSSSSTSTSSSSTSTASSSTSTSSSSSTGSGGIGDTPYYSNEFIIGNSAPAGSFNNNYWRSGEGANGVPLHHAYWSEANQTYVGFDVLFPPSYDTQTTKRYPVIYHLHGHGGSESGLTSSYMPDAYQAQQSGTPEFLYVSVGGPSDCWWSDSYDGTVMAESHIINELISIVDQNFRTLPNRESRAIEGFSMGGFGATKIAFKYPQYFAATGAFCGAIYTAYNDTDGNTGMTSSPYAGNYSFIWNDDENLFKQDSSRHLVTIKAAELISYGMVVHLRPGNGDSLFKGYSTSFQTELQSYGITPNFTWYSGGHDLNVYDQASYDFLANSLVHQ